MTIRVTIWHEYRHEHENPKVAAVYPEGMHKALQSGLQSNSDFEIRTATLDEPDHGLPQEVLETTDVLLWWGHKAHGDVEDETVERVYQRVLAGMGLIVLHSAHYSKIFRKLMGTSCSLKWREANDKERFWVVNPGHPITTGLPEYFELRYEEMYGEHFDIPQPDELVLISWFTGGEVFRSGACWYRGSGRVFYFRPGHETYPSYYDPTVLQTIANGIRWAAPVGGPVPSYAIYAPVASIEPLPAE